MFWLCSNNNCALLWRACWSAILICLSKVPVIFSSVFLYFLSTNVCTLHVAILMCILSCSAFLQCIKFDLLCQVHVMSTCTLCIYVVLWLITVRAYSGQFPSRSWWITCLCWWLLRYSYSIDFCSFVRSFVGLLFSVLIFSSFAFGLSFHYRPSEPHPCLDAGPKTSDGISSTIVSLLQLLLVSLHAWVTVTNMWWSL